MRLPHWYDVKANERKPAETALVEVRKIFDDMKAFIKQYEAVEHPQYVDVEGFIKTCIARFDNLQTTKYLKGKTK